MMLSRLSAWLRGSEPRRAMRLVNWQTADRIEHVTIFFTMSGDVYNRSSDLVHDLEMMRGVDRVDSDATVKLEFQFTAEYYGVVHQLLAIIELLDDPAVESAFIGERSGLNLLFVDLVDAIREVQRRIEQSTS